MCLSMPHTREQEIKGTLEEGRDKRESKCVKFLLTLGPEGLEEAMKMFFLFAVLN